MLSPQAQGNLRYLIETYQAFSECPCPGTVTGNTVQFEVEIRAGKIQGNGAFESSVDAWYFYAIFEALYMRSDSLAGPIEKTTHLCHEGFLRQELHPAQGVEGGAWTRKSIVEGCQKTDRTVGENRWFDVRMSLAKETRLGKREAREAASSMDAWAPKNGLRTRTRRSLRFLGAAPAWRVDFTHVTTQYPPSVSLPVIDTFEVEFELLPDQQTRNAEDLVAQAVHLLALVRDAVAGNERAMQNAIYAQSQRWQSMHSYKTC